jgi:hypothetical protein
MGEYEPRDSRNVTQSTHRAPGEPERTGPRENQTRQAPKQPQGEETQQGELTEDERGEDVEATVAVEQQQEQSQPPTGRVGEAAQEWDEEGEGAERFDRND